MSPRTGRPKSELTMTKSIKIRFDDETYERILKFCKDNSISRTQCIRRAVNAFLEEK